MLVLTDSLLSCSQPWVLWQPCVGRWVLCVSLAKSKNNRANPKIKRSHLFVSALPASFIPPECVCSSDALLCLVLLQQLSALWFVWRSSFSETLFVRLPSQLQKPRPVPLWTGATSRSPSLSWFCCCLRCSAELTSTSRGELCKRSD